MKKASLFLVALLVSASLLHAQGAPKKVLNAKDFDRFLKDFPAISAELEAQGVEGPGETADMDGFDPSSMEPFHVTMGKNLQAMKTVPAWRKTLAKYGWTDAFWDYLFTSLVSVYAIAMEELPLDSLPPEFARQLKETRASVHPDDLGLVRKNFERTAHVFEAGE